MELGWSDKGLNPQQHEMLLQLMDEMGIKEPRSIEIKVATTPGDNYLGCVYRVNVKGMREKIESKEQWIVKTMPDNKARRDFFDTPIYFSNEIMFYKFVIPGLSSLLSTNEPPLAAPHCYRVLCDGVNDALVLQDLSIEGYRMADRMKGLDASHCRLALRELARLHALSFVMKAKYPDRFNELKNSSVKETLFSLPREKLDDFKKLVERSIQLLHQSYDDDSKYIKKLEKFIGSDYNDVMCKMSTECDDKYSVITHGDCWTNNLLFRYEEKKPIDVKLLDFQLSRYASPTFDIMYLICCCTNRATRSSHFASLMDGYHKDLVSILASHGEDCALYSREQLDIDLSRYGGRWGFGMALLVIKVLCKDKEDMPHMDRLTSPEEGFGSVFSEESSSDQVCQEHLTDLLRDLVDLNLL